MPYTVPTFMIVLASILRLIVLKKDPVINAPNPPSPNLPVGNAKALIMLSVIAPRPSTTSSETATSDMNVDKTMSDNTPTSDTPEVMGDDTEMDDSHMNDTSPVDKHSISLASSQLSIGILSTTIEDNANNDSPTLIDPEDQIMATVSDELQFIHENSESIGRQLSDTNKYKASKVVRSTSEAAGATLTRSSSSLLSSDTETYLDNYVPIDINIKIASLNCNGLAKVNNTNIRSDMIRFL
ncbi:hypothetical protein BD770DRAFT_417132, partial [Pilaira anomala]